MNETFFEPGTGCILSPQPLESLIPYPLYSILSSDIQILQYFRIWNRQKKSNLKSEEVRRTGRLARRSQPSRQSEDWSQLQGIFFAAWTNRKLYQSRPIRSKKMKLANRAAILAYSSSFVNGFDQSNQSSLHEIHDDRFNRLETIHENTDQSNSSEEKFVTKTPIVRAVVAKKYIQQWFDKNCPQDPNSPDAIR